VNAVAELLKDDDGPPPSGVRLRALPAPAAVHVQRADPYVSVGSLEALALVGEEVFLETWEVVRALSPLQGAWLRLGLGQLGAAVLTVGAFRYGKHPRTALTANVLRERWPELVPGATAMDCLAGVMVDAIC
jgi:hypothetical protein